MMPRTAAVPRLLAALTAQPNTILPLIRADAMSAMLLICRLPRRFARRPLPPPMLPPPCLSHDAFISLFTVSARSRLAGACAAPRHAAAIFMLLPLLFIVATMPAPRCCAHAHDDVILRCASAQRAALCRDAAAPVRRYASAGAGRSMLCSTYAINDALSAAAMPLPAGEMPRCFDTRFRRHCRRRFFALRYAPPLPPHARLRRFRYAMSDLFSMLRHDAFIELRAPRMPCRRLRFSLPAMPAAALSAGLRHYF